MVKDKLQSNEPDHRYPFWDRPKSWPGDPPGYTFLARACHELGHTIFGAQYNEKYSSIDDLEEQIEPPDDCDEATWDAFERKCDEFERSFNAMRAEVARTLSQALEVGDLIAALRPKPGGQLTKLEANFWFTENVEVRFEHCDMSSSEPFRTKRPLYDACWIYIERSSLAQLLTRLSPKAVLSGQVEASINSVPDSEPFRQPRAHVKHLAVKALTALYGAGGTLPLGVTEEECLRAVGEWMRKNGASHGVSKATVRRAKHEWRGGNRRS